MKQKEIWDKSIHDPLTGIFNRRFYKEEIQNMDKEENLPLTVAMVDMDGLKWINDTLGHAFGDRAIRQCVEVLQKNADSRFIIVRIGGDEFVIFMRNTKLEEARTYLNLSKRSIRNIDVSGIPLSFSWGAATKHTMEEELTYICAAAEDMMYSRKQSNRGSRGTDEVEAILQSLFERNTQIKEHSYRVADFMEHYAVWRGLGDEEKLFYRYLGIIHDIGMASISDELLNKKGSLNEKEKMDILRHSEIRGRILHTSLKLTDIADIVLCHHENWDGSGYPQGLKKEQIPFEARILTIADACDRMKHGLNGFEPRYKTDMEIWEELKRCSGKQFDSELVKDVVKWGPIL